MQVNEEIMDYDNLETKNKHYVSGKISQYMDAYIRQNKVWTPEQMQESFYLHMQEQINKGWFKLSNYVDGQFLESSERLDRWLLTQEGIDTAYVRMSKKYEKDKKVAKADSPIIERLRFGHYWDNSVNYDIAYGLKDGHNFIPTEELKEYPHKAWSIAHVEQQLKDKYSTNLPAALAALSSSYIEVVFYKYWLNYYYQNKNNPAIIPEVNGFRPRFYYLEYNGKVYANHNDIPGRANLNDIKWKNFRFDFFVSNPKKKKAAVIELDGHEFHKTVDQRVIDSIKRNTAVQHNISIIVFTGTQITRNIDAVFEQIGDFLNE